MTEKQALKRLRDRMEGYDSQKAAAAKMGLTPTQLNNVLKGKRGVSESVAAKIGLRLVVKTTRSYKEIA